MYKFFRLRIVILFLSLSIAAGSYAFMPDSTYRYMVQGMSVVSTKQTPFWMVNNRLGLSSLNRSNGYLRAAAFRDIDSTRRFSWGAGVDLVAPYNFTSKFVIQQLYGEVKYRSLQLTVGSKERYMGLVNQELSSGDMVFSLNARPCHARLSMGTLDSQLVGYQRLLFFRYVYRRTLGAASLRWSCVMG